MREADVAAAAQTVLMKWFPTLTAAQCKMCADEIAAGARQVTATMAHADDYKPMPYGLDKIVGRKTT